MLGKSYTRPPKSVSYGRDQDLRPAEITQARENLHLPTNEPLNVADGTVLRGFDETYRSVFENGYAILWSDAGPGILTDVVLPWTPYAAKLNRNVLLQYNANVRNVHIPDSVVELIDSVFRSSAYLEHVRLPLGLTRIGYETFAEAGDLGSGLTMTLPEGIKVIDTSAFYEARRLSTLNFPKSLEVIGTSAFQRSGLSGRIEIMGGDIFDHAFTACGSIQELYFGPDVKSVGSFSFGSCDELETVVIDEGMQKLGFGAFSFCSSLTRVELPSTLRELGGDTFFYADQMEYLSCRALVAPVIFGWRTTLGGSVTEIHVPEGAEGYGSTYGGLTVIYDLE